jgi:predicted 2-oxoglutarate/Fe(II)-dependent dioxygenase YbiX
MRMTVIKISLFLLALSLFSCFPSQKNNANARAASRDDEAADGKSEFAAQLAAVMRNAQLPAALSANIQAAAAEELSLWKAIQYRAIRYP